MSAASPIKGMGDKHVATGKNKGLRSVPMSAVNAGFAGKSAGKGLRSVPKTATSTKFAGKA